MHISKLYKNKNLYKYSAAPELDTKQQLTPESTGDVTLIMHFH